MTSVEPLRQALSITSAPVVNAGLATTIRFFESTLGVNPMEWLDYVKGIDFHKPISLVTLAPHTRLIRFDTLSRWRLTPFSYFTGAGVSPFHLGLSPDQWEFREYTVTRPTQALVSSASDMAFGPGRPSRVGGGVQYIVSRADWPKLLRVSDVKRS
jgi:hypothetical protein